MSQELQDYQDLTNERAVAGITRLLRVVTKSARLLRLDKWKSCYKNYKIIERYHKDYKIIKTW